MRNSSSQAASGASVVACNHCGFGRAVLYVGPKVRPRVSGEKRAEDVLPSWRSMRSLTVNGTALGLGSGSLAGNGETSRGACSLRMWVSRRIERVFCAKKMAFKSLRTRLTPAGYGAAKGLGFAGERADLRDRPAVHFRSQRGLRGTHANGSART